MELNALRWPLVGAKDPKFVLHWLLHSACMPCFFAATLPDEPAPCHYKTCISLTLYPLWEIMPWLVPPCCVEFICWCILCRGLSFFLGILQVATMGVIDAHGGQSVSSASWRASGLVLYTGDPFFDVCPRDGCYGLLLDQPLWALTDQEVLAWLAVKLANFLPSLPYFDLLLLVVRNAAFTSLTLSW